MGPILVPNIPILRKAKDGEKFTAFLSSDTVKQSAHNFQMRGLQNSSTLEHAVRIDGVSVVETWIVDDPKKDKSAIHLEEQEPGTWMGVFKVENDKIWEEYVKTGIVRGFSIEGNYKPVSRGQHMSEQEGMEEAYNALVQGLRDIQSRIADK